MASHFYNSITHISQTVYEHSHKPNGTKPQKADADPTRVQLYREIDN